VFHHHVNTVSALERILEKFTLNCLTVFKQLSSLLDTYLVLDDMRVIQGCQKSYFSHNVLTLTRTGQKSTVLKGQSACTDSGFWLVVFMAKYSLLTNPRKSVNGTVRHVQFIKVICFITFSPLSGLGREGVKEIVLHVQFQRVTCSSSSITFSTASGVGTKKKQIRKKNFGTGCFSNSGHMQHVNVKKDVNKTSKS